MSDELSQLDSETLHGKCRQGEDRAVAALLDRHMGDLLAYVRLNIPRNLRERESVSDIVQSVCCEILARPERLEYRGEGPFRNWLYGAVLNKIRDHERFFQRDKRDVRRERRVEDFGSIALLRDHGRPGTPSRHAMTQESLERIEAAFDKLDPAQKDLILLAKVVKLPQSEIAAQLGIGVGAMRSRLTRAVARLAVLIDQEMG